TRGVLKRNIRAGFDLESALETLVENATKLCAVQHGLIYRFDGESFQPAAGYNVHPGHKESVQRNPPLPGRTTAVGRVLLERRTRSEQRRVGIVGTGRPRTEHVR